MSAFTDTFGNSATPTAPKVPVAPEVKPSSGSAFASTFGNKVETKIEPINTSGSAFASTFGNGKTIQSTDIQPKTLSQKYQDFVDRGEQLASEFDIGAIKSIGGLIDTVSSVVKKSIPTAGGMISPLNWFMPHVEKSLDEANKPTTGEKIKTFADNLNTGVKQEDKNYLDNLAEGLGSAVPWIAGGTIAKALKIPAAVSSLGLGAIQALDTSRNDYHEMIKNGDKNANIKSAGIFALDTALNTAAHFLGPLAQGEKVGIFPSISRILKSTALETANYGFTQPIISNVANKRPAMQGVWNSVLTMAPISAIFGISGEMVNDPAIKTKQKQIQGVIDETIKNGGTPKDATIVLSSLTGISTDEIRPKVDEYINQNKELTTITQEGKTKENIINKEQSNIPLSSPELVKEIPDIEVAKAMEAKDHPEIAKSNPELLEQIVKDEYKGDKEGYQKEVDKFKGENNKQEESINNTVQSGLAKNTEEKAFDAGIELDHPNIPESEKMNMIKTRQEAMNFVNKDPEMAKKILNHEEGAELPSNLREGAIYTAMRIKAIKEKDIDTLMFLTESKAAAESAAEKGREVKAYDDGTNSGDPVKIAKNINEELAIKLKRKTGKKADRELPKQKKIIKEQSEKIKKEVVKKVVKKQTLEDFISSIKC